MNRELACNPLYRWIWIIAIIIPKTILYSATVNVTTNADNGPGSLHQAIMDVNSRSDSSNTINMQIPGNSPIYLSSDLPVMKKNTEIISSGQQTINGNGQYRLFATIMADLTLTNCTLENGAAIGGDGAGGGMGAGGAIYIDRGNILTLSTTYINNCIARGGNNIYLYGGGGGASFSTFDKNGNEKGNGGGDYPGLSLENGGNGGISDNSSFLIGYGGGNGGGRWGESNGGGNGSAQRRNGGYCGGGGEVTMIIQYLAEGVIRVRHDMEF